MEVLVFKTSVTKQTQVSKVRALLTNMPAIIRWNFDLDDRDKILRIVSNQVCPRQVELALQTAGFSCQELED